MITKIHKMVMFIEITFLQTTQKHVSNMLTELSKLSAIADSISQTAFFASFTRASGALETKYFILEWKLKSGQWTIPCKSVSREKNSYSHYWQNLSTLSSLSLTEYNFLLHICMFTILPYLFMMAK